MRKCISIITPCYNEEDNIQQCYQAIKDLFEETLCDYDREHIFCDNASSDNSVHILKEIARADKNVKVILNARNFGPFRSTFNGLIQAKGDAIVPMLAADLQDPPEVIVDFVQLWEKGFEVVFGVRKKREEGFVLRTARKVYYRIVNSLADINIPPDAGEFQLIDRKVLNALKQFDDHYPYIRGMIASCGFRSTGINYVWKSRKLGISRNNLYHLIDQGMNGIISFTQIPLRLCMLVGFFLAFISLSYAFITLALNLIFFREFTAPGIATLITALFFFSGIQLFFLGFLGEYIGAIHFQVRKRPLVIEREKINF